MRLDINISRAHSHFLFSSNVIVQVILDVTKGSLFNNLKRSLTRYSEIARPEWLMHKNPTTGQDG